jgi:hypothetical protein
MDLNLTARTVKFLGGRGNGNGDSGQAQTEPEPIVDEFESDEIPF